MKGKQQGGDAFTRLCLTMTGEECVREYRFDATRRWRFDYAFPAQRVALEVEGGAWTQGRHTRPRGFLNDLEKYNAATVQGWRVLRTTPAELFTEKTLKMLLKTLEMVQKNLKSEKNA